MTDEYTREDLLRIGRVWLDRIKAAEKREKDWTDEAEKAEDAYSVKDGDNELAWFNIVHSNIETIVPSLYNSTPKPDIRPRHANNDPISKNAADALERGISTQIDDSRLDTEVERLAQDAFLAGRGIIRLRFDADEIPAEYAEVEVLGFDGEPVVQEVEVSPARVENERVVFENVSWRDYREGPAKRWRDVEWVCFRHEVSEAERRRLEDPELVAKQKTDTEKAEEDEDCTVWEIWCKEERKVYFLSEESGLVLQVMEDPLGLDGFFPMPEPVQPITLTGKRCPVCPYSVYERLAKELNLATRRINSIMKGLKVRGLVATAAEAIQELSEAGDNELVPVANVESLVAMGGLEKAVMWWPIETAVNVLRELYVQREQVKQAIYEITGISDIVRGASSSSETATAQQIKTQWGSLRIKKMQRAIERQVRDIFVMTADIMSQHFSDQQLAQAAGMQIDPQAMQVLRNPMRHYRIDVETDSTIRADLTKSRSEMSEFLQGSAQFFNTMAPIVAQAPAAAGPVVDMYAAFARQFNLGKTGEDALEQFAEMAKQAASQPKPNPEADAMKAEMEMKQREQQQNFMLGVFDRVLKREELGQKAQKLGLDEATAEVDAAAKFAEVGLEQSQKRPVAIGDR